jgi:hypothetical protein
MPTDTSPHTSPATSPAKNTTNYIAEFDDIDKMCFEIAKSHLKSSFNIEKSVGYKKFHAKK